MNTKTQKREELKELSKLAREFQKKQITANTDNVALVDWGNRTLNFILLNYFYINENETIFKTFEQWKAQGATIRRGEKARYIWGQPIHKERDGKEYSFSPLIAVFSNAQIYMPSTPTTSNEVVNNINDIL